MISRMALVFMLIAPSTCIAADIPNKDLLADCSKKTTVFGRDADKLVPVGESISGFCSGYLQATLSAITNDGTCEAPGDDPVFLLSVYTQFIKEINITESASASQTLTHAFKRIVQCKAP